MPDCTRDKLIWQKLLTLGEPLTLVKDTHIRASIRNASYSVAGVPSVIMFDITMAVGFRAAQSPDLSSIQHLWGKLEHQLLAEHITQHQLTNVPITNSTNIYLGFRVSVMDTLQLECPNMSLTETSKLFASCSADHWPHRDSGHWHSDALCCILSRGAKNSSDKFNTRHL